jgi:hypothetical protein
VVGGKPTNTGAVTFPEPAYQLGAAHDLNERPAKPWVAIMAEFTGRHAALQAIVDS